MTLLGHQCHLPGSQDGAFTFQAKDLPSFFSFSATLEPSLGRLVKLVYCTAGRQWRETVSSAIAFGVYLLPCRSFE